MLNEHIAKTVPFFIFRIFEAEIDENSYEALIHLAPTDVSFRQGLDPCEFSSLIYYIHLSLRHFPRFAS